MSGTKTKTMHPSFHREKGDVPLNPARSFSVTACIPKEHINE